MLPAVYERDYAIRENGIEHAIHFIGEHDCVFVNYAVQQQSTGKKLPDLSFTLFE